MEQMILRLQNQLENLRKERQTLELSFKDKVDVLNRQLEQSKIETMQIKEERDRVDSKWKEQIGKKEEELELLRTNHEMQNGEVDMGRRRTEELQEKVRFLEEELNKERAKVLSLSQELEMQKSQLQERSQLLDTLREENKATSNNLNSINTTIVEKLNVLEKQRESCPKHLTNLKEIQESIFKLNSELTGLRNENKLLLEGRDVWFREIKTEIEKMKESQLRPPVVMEQNVGNLPPTKVVKGRESIGKVTYYNHRTEQSPIVYRTETRVVSFFFYFFFMKKDQK
jgi:chromosome segregation ATPase